MWFFDNAAKDARKIHESVDYRVLRAAWDSYVRIRKHDFSEVHHHSQPTWFALYEVESNNGKWKLFDVEDLELLEAFVSIEESLNGIIESLENKKSDETFCAYVFATHTDLHDLLPPEYNSQDMVIDYIVIIMKEYKKMLLEFYKKYKKDIDSTIARLRASKKLDGMEGA